MLKKFFIIVFLSIFMGCPYTSPGPEWKTGVVLGDKFISKKVWLPTYEFESITQITDIAIDKKEFHGKAEDLVVIVSPKGCVFVDKKGTIKKDIKFNIIGNEVEVLDAFPKTNIGFIDREAPVAIYDNKGDRLWSYGGNPGNFTPNDMAAGDINGDGIPEFVVGCGASGGILLLNAEGKVIWKKPDKNVWHVAMLDIDGDGKNEIVHSNASGLLVIRNQHGKIIKETKLFLYFGRFSLIQWPIEKISKNCLLVSADKKIQIIDPQTGKKVALFDAPQAPENYAKGVLINFEHAKKPYLAVLVKVKATWNRSILYIYSPEGDLLYQEILPLYTSVLASMTNLEAGNDSLLVGGLNEVLAYELKGTSKSAIKNDIL